MKQAGMDPHVVHVQPHPLHAFEARLKLDFQRNPPLDMSPDEAVTGLLELALAEA